MVQKAQLIEELHGSITSDDILGKDVIDPAGEFLGIVEQVHIDPSNLDTLGVSIDKGIFKKGLVIGKQYIDRITSHAVFLNIRPAFNLRGMTVYDVEGARVGTVTQIGLVGHTNNLNEIVIKVGFMKKPIHVPAEYVARVGHHVFLNVPKKTLEK